MSQQNQQPQEEHKSLLQKAAEAIRNIPVTLGLVDKSNEKTDVGSDTSSSSKGEVQKGKKEEWIGQEHIQTDLQDDVISSLERPHEMKPTQLGTVDLTGTAFEKDIKDTEINK